MIQKQNWSHFTFEEIRLFLFVERLPDAFDRVEPLHGNISIDINFFASFLMEGSHMTKIWYLVWMFVQPAVQCYFKVNEKKSLDRKELTDKN